METLCKIRDLYRSIADFESRFEKEYDLCLNEGMLLCSLLNIDKLSSGSIAEYLGLSSSNTSKIIKHVEEKELIIRVIGDMDKRQMYFSLTNKGREVINKIKCNKIEMPQLLLNVVEK